MKLITGHIWWWALLLTGTVIVSAITSYEITLYGIFSSISGHLLFAVGVALIPWIFYRLIGKPLTTEQMMATITVGWLILTVANLSV
ncbi:MAG: hypothetical protein JJU37_02320 [Balneolaceae bacterium]|nr:hypothetical protein [Balneolaceae bacterium]